ncbi:MAG: serine hydrolase domain-containing protein [Acidimicrobiales bacterium]
MSRGLTPHVDFEYSPSSQKLSPKVRDRLASVLLATLDTSFPSGFNLAVVDKSGTMLRAWGGYANRVEPVIGTRRETIYDLASLTKVVSTTTLALWLEQQGRWKLSDPVDRWLPGFSRNDLTLHQLLTHTSGLIPHRPFFHLGKEPRAIRRGVYNEAARGGASGKVLYSDLNFMLLGWAIASCAGEPLDRLFHDVAAEPLHMDHTRYRPSRRVRPLIAATERNGDQRNEAQLVWGEVHDGNAWALGGVAGHAGLFGPADDLARFVTALLNPRHHPVLRYSSIARMSKYQAGRQPDVRGLGWRLQPKEWGAWPEGTYWHNGFTGTSLLVAPRANLGVVLLTNAIHPTRHLEKQANFRTTIHRTLARSLS